MGIRYYAYAFEDHMTDQALAFPRSILAGDPHADAWGGEPGASISVVTLEQHTPERDMLYLDKAWRHLQIITGPEIRGAAARPAHRMFEGAVTMDHDHMGWDPWLRVLRPEEVPAIAEDLEGISESEAKSLLRTRAYLGEEPEREIEYACLHFHRARTFMTHLRADGRGMVYMIG